MVQANGLGERVVMTGCCAGRSGWRRWRMRTCCAAELSGEFRGGGGGGAGGGTPVIVSDQVNIHAEISAAGVGAVVPTQVEPLGRELMRWLGDADLRAAAAGRARAFVWERYDWTKIAQRWVGHYGR